jgi:hypothetical protein
MNQATPDKLAAVNARESDNGIEWGEYVERNDGGAWTPLVYTAGSEREVAEEWATGDKPDEYYRNARLVRRVVGDWKVAE